MAGRGELERLEQLNKCSYEWALLV